MARGNNKQVIFKDEQDYRIYVNRLKKYHERYKFILYAYVLMSNHIHLLIETGMTPLSKIMQGIQQSYTAYFHKKYNSVGHLFQGRYIAILCQKDAYILELVRYIHLNPVRAFLVKWPNDYLWSSHQVYIGSMYQSFIQKDFVFKMFTEDKFEGKKLYCQFILEGIDKGYRNIFGNVVNQTYLGSKKFIEKVNERSKKQDQKERKKRENNIKDSLEIVFLRNKDLTEIMEAVAKITGVTSTSILGKNKEQLISRARSLFAFIAVRQAGWSNKSVAEFLNRGVSGISNMIRTVDERIEKDNVLRNQMDEITEVFKV